MAGARSDATLTWPLVGRQGELAQILEARSVGATGAVISGEAGVGKTRLARQAILDAEAAGAYVAWTRATRSSSPIPLAALGTLVPAGTPAGEDAGLVQTITAGLRAQAGTREIVLGVDDSHLLDPASATVLLHLAEHDVAFVIATTRTGASSLDAMTALWKDAGAIRIELGSLGESQMEALVQTALGGPLERGGHRWLARTSAGNILYAQQLLAGAIDSGALAQSNGIWQLTEPPPPSPSLRELIAERMGALTDAERAALELVALGEPLAVAEARGLLTADTLTALESKRLVVAEPTTDGAGELRVAQPLYGESVLVAMPVSRGNAHRVRLAELVSARSARSPAHEVRIARWLIEAGEPVAVATLLDAARAVNLAGAEGGEDFAQRALAAGAGAEANMLLASAQYVHGRASEAEAALAEVEGEIADPDRALAYLRERAAILYWGLGRGEEAVRLLDRALEWWPEEGWQKQVGMLRLHFAALSSPPGVMAAELERALAAGAPDEATRWLKRALTADRFWAGLVREADAMLGEVPELPLRGELEFLEFATIATIGLASGCDLPGLERDMRAAFESAADAADHAAAGLAAMTVAASNYLAGRLLDCGRWINEAIAQSRRQDPFGVRLMARSLQAGTFLALSDHERAIAVARELQDDYGDAAAPQSGGPASRRGFGPWLARGRACGKLAEADPPAAQALLLDAARDQEWAPVYAAELTYEAMRAGKPARELSQTLGELAERCDAPLTHAYTAHVAARASGDATAMLDAAETFAALGVTLYASEAAAHAAAAFASEGRQDSARRAAARSRELQVDGQGIEAMSIEGVDRAEIELTPREAQMVELAARGLTNSEIAEKLVLSTRTVETHIYRAMRKLGVNNRKDFRPGHPGS